MTFYTHIHLKMDLTAGLTAVFCCLCMFQACFISLNIIYWLDVAMFCFLRKSICTTEK